MSGDDERGSAAEDFPERPVPARGLQASDEFNIGRGASGWVNPKEQAREKENDGDRDRGRTADGGREDGREDGSADGRADADGDADWNLLTSDGIRDLRKSAKFIVSLIGYPGAGKTFFLNRLKYSYSHFEFTDGRKFAIDPPYDTAEVGRTTANSYHLFNRLREEERDADAAVHAPGGSDKDFILFDLPGEQFRRAIERGMRGPLATVLTDAIAVSDALILLFPAELLFGSKDGPEAIIAAQLDAAEDELDRLHAEEPPVPAEEAPAAAEDEDRQSARRRRQRGRAKSIADRQVRRAWEARCAELEALISDLEQKLDSPEALEESKAILALDRQRLNTFVQHLASMVSRIAAMKKYGKSAAEMDAMDREERDALIRQTAFLSYAPLIYVGISKADALLSTESPIVPLRREIRDSIERAQIDGYPRDATAACEAAIYNSISSTFRWYKFDFLTSFKGQSHTLYGAIGATAETASQKIDYDLPDFGVRGVIDWLEFAKTKSTLLGKRGLRAKLAAAELRLVRRAERSIVGERALRGREKPRFGDGLARKFIEAKPATVRNWLLGAAAGVALLTVWTTGVAGAAWLKVSGDRGGYEVPVQPRYPVEAARLRTQPAFRTGWLSQGPQPWSDVPSGGRMFAVPATRRVRETFLSVLADVQRLPKDARIDPAAGRALLERLTRAQAEMNEEYAATTSTDRFRERPFIHLHSGYVQLRMGDANGAVESYARAIDLLGGASAANREERGRLLGVTVAAFHGRGYAAIESGALEAAKRDLESARGLLPRPQSRERILLTPSPTGFFFTSDPQRTPAVLNSADVWADSLAAHIRGFDAARDLAPDSPMMRMLNELSRWRTDIPRDHPLAANYVIAAALVGRPLGEVRIGIEGSEPRQEAARIAKRSLGEPGRSDVWAAASSLRVAFARGDAENVRQILARWSDADTVPPADTAFVRSLASEIVTAERLRLPRGEREPLLDAFGEHVRGTGFLSLANDLSRMGGFILGLLPLLLLAGLILLYRLHSGSRTTSDKLLEPRHREDRLAREAADAAEQAG